MSTKEITLRSALEELLQEYVRGANSGDWGNWDPEQEEIVINARKALATTSRAVVQFQKDCAKVTASLATPKPEASAANQQAGEARPWEELRAEILHGLDGFTNEQTNDVLRLIDFYTPDAAPISEGTSKGFPERDKTKPAEEQGMFEKFRVQRLDGSDCGGGKHYGCRYFVLDLNHDAHAPDAMRAYAESCRATHPQLAADIEAEFPAAPAACNGDAPPLPESIYLSEVAVDTDLHTREHLIAYGDARAKHEQRKIARTGTGSAGSAAYMGACEDMGIWKRRALEAEEACRKMTAALNAENGPTFMGEPDTSAMKVKAAPGNACEWTLTDDDNGIWESSCGEAWSFIDGGPKENRVRFCQGCGKPTHIVTTNTATDEEQP